MVLYGISKAPTLNEARPETVTETHQIQYPIRTATCVRLAIEFAPLDGEVCVKWKRNKHGPCKNASQAHATKRVAKKLLCHMPS